MCFPSFFDSVNSVVNSAADEMLNPISTKRHEYGSVGQFITAFVQCVFNPPRARRKVSGSINVIMPVSRKILRTVE